MSREALRREPSLTPEALSDLLRKPDLSPQEREQAVRFLQAIAARLKERVGTITTEFGPRRPSEYVLAYLSIPLVPKLIPQRSNPAEGHDLTLEVRLLPGRIWWGVHAWGEEKQIRRLAEAVRILGLLESHEEPEVRPGALGYPPEKWAGGAYFALGHAYIAEEVAQQHDLRVLMERIAKDLADYHERFAPGEAALRRAMGVDAPIQIPEEIRRVWIFQANPDRFDLRSWLEEYQGREDSWYTGKKYSRQIAKGDLILFWKSGSRRGIYGLGQVLSPAYTNEEGDTLVDLMVLKPISPPILAETLERDEVLRNMEIFRVKRGTVFPVKPEEWERLKMILEHRSLEDRAARLMPLSGRQLADLLQKSFQAQGLHFTPEQIATFYTALQTKGFVILSGISGTGKTKLAQHFAALLSPRLPTDIDRENRFLVTVTATALQRGRLTVPKRAWQLFTPPDPMEFVKIPVDFGEGQEICRLFHSAYKGIHTMNLELCGEAHRWLQEHFQEKDRLYLELQTDTQGNLRGIRLSIPEEVAAEQNETSGRNWLFLAVRPDWRDGKPLLGYYNPLTGTYHWTPFLRFVLQASRSYRTGDGLAWFVILDEMNLARVEYYFADLLSVLESGRDEEGWTREPLRCEYPEDAEGDLPPREIFLPPNLYIVGTVNVDETTHALSPKVLDRAFTLELTEADFAAYLGTTGEGSPDLSEETRRVLLTGFTRQGRFVRQDKAALRDFVTEHPWVAQWLTALNKALRPYELHFGYRVFDEIVAFLQAAEENGLFDPLGGLERAFDRAVLMKVLPKFHGSRGRLEAPLKQVLAWSVNPEEPAVATVEKTLQEALSEHDDPRRALDAVAERLEMRLPRTADKVLRMLWHLYTTGFAAF